MKQLYYILLFFTIRVILLGQTSPKKFEHVKHMAYTYFAASGLRSLTLPRGILTLLLYNPGNDIVHNYQRIIH